MLLCTSFVFHENLTNSLCIPFIFNQLKKNYTDKFPDSNNIIFINKAASSKTGTLELTVPSEKNDFNKLPWYASQLGSVNDNHISGHLDQLTPVELAGLIQSIVTEVNRPDLWSGFMPSAVADEVFNDLSNIRRELFRIQERLGIEVPIIWSSELMGLVEAWARGTSWTDLISNTSLDEGDIVRILRRTNDLLSQIPYCEAVSRQLRNNAKVAMKLMDRFPVCEAEDINQTNKKNHELINPATTRNKLD